MDSPKGITINYRNICFYLTIGISFYYLLWIFGVPFIPIESSLKSLFPSQIYAMIIPLFLFWMGAFVALLIIKY